MSINIDMNVSTSMSMSLVDYEYEFMCFSNNLNMISNFMIISMSINIFRI